MGANFFELVGPNKTIIGISAKPIMIGLADIPMIVLFGPTNSKKFAPKVKNIEILDSKIIYNSEDISNITEDDVLKLI